MLSLQATLDDLGKGLGPAIVAGLISVLGSRSAAFNVAVCGWIPCGLLIFCSGFTLERDEKAMQQRLTALAPAPEALASLELAVIYDDFLPEMSLEAQ